MEEPQFLFEKMKPVAIADKGVITEERARDAVLTSPPNFPFFQECSERSIFDAKCTSWMTVTSLPAPDYTYQPSQRYYSSAATPLEQADRPISTSLPTPASGRAYCFLPRKFLSAYRKLFTTVFAANLAVLVSLLARSSKGSEHGLTMSTTTTATAVNLLMSIIIRQERVVNLLFLISSSLGTLCPLFIRRRVAKIYSYGGLHSGCGVAAVFWYLAFTILVTKHLFVEPHISTAIAIITYLNIGLLISITTFAHPTVRARLHDFFEATHRFAGWTLVILFWTQTILTAHLNSRVDPDTSLSDEIVLLPAFWCLLLLTLSIVYPWARLRRRKVRHEHLSNHAIRLHFDYAKIDYCMGVRLSDNPLKETHAFAAIPHPDGGRGFSVVVSDAGDWTKHIIQHPPQKLWVRGVPLYNVLRVAVMFKPVLIVATGSGIGPCLSLFYGKPDLDCRILWSASNPLHTYGQAIVNSVLRADRRAVMIDTKVAGRPDMVSLTYQIVQESNCEAVFVISNPKVTGAVVYGMETRGIPAYGPIFDS